MKNKSILWSMLSIAVLASMILAACAPATEATATEAPATEMPATEAPATEMPATEAPATEAPAAMAQGQEINDAYAGMYKGTVVTMTGPFTDNDAVKFDASVKAFEDATGIDIQ